MNERASEQANERTNKQHTTQQKKKSKQNQTNPNKTNTTKQKLTKKATHNMQTTTHERKAWSKDAARSWEQLCCQSPDKLKMSTWGPPGSNFAARAQKCSKLRSGALLGTTLQAEPRNAQNEHLGTSWEPLCSQSPEMLKMSIWGPPGNHFAARAQKCSK